MIMHGLANPKKRLYFVIVINLGFHGRQVILAPT
jgi:hypothetical protein